MTDEKLDAAGKLAEEVEKDFLKRREERRFIERGWLLNMNFVNGSQYCDLDARGELAEEKKEFYWQERRVFNHIAPVIDSRLSKLSRIRPALTVRAASEACVGYTCRGTGGLRRRRCDDRRRDMVGGVRHCLLQGYVERKQGQRSGCFTGRKEGLRRASRFGCRFPLRDLSLLA